jgi:hypothetical protein
VRTLLPAGAALVRGAGPFADPRCFASGEKSLQHPELLGVGENASLEGLGE